MARVQWDLGSALGDAIDYRRGPEYDEERDPSALQAALKQYGIIWPVAVDNESRIWNAYGNRYWRALYLVDRSGRVVYCHYGEGDYEQTEARIRALLGKA